MKTTTAVGERVRVHWQGEGHAVELDRRFADLLEESELLGVAEYTFDVYIVPYHHKLPPNGGVNMKFRTILITIVLLATCG